MESKTRKIGIVGGGLLGITLALRLREHGFQVTLIEAAPHLGGLASPTRIGNFTWDQFYHVILASDTNLIRLLEQLNLKDQIHWEQARTGFFTDGHLYSMSNIMEFLTFRPLTLTDKIRLGFTIFYASKVKVWERLEGVLVAEWLNRLSGKRTFNKIWLPLLKSKLGECYKITSATFIWATIARMYAARRSGLKQEMFGYVDGAYATILDRFQKVLKKEEVQTLCGNPVSKVVVNTSHTTVEMTGQRDMEFDEVILTIPCPRIPTLCPQLSVEEKERFRNVNYQGVICLALILRKPLAEYYITNITDKGLPFTAVIEMTAVVDKKYVGGNSLVYLPRYLSPEDSFWKKEDDEIRGEFAEVLEGIYPSFKSEDILASKVVRAKEVFPITTLHYSSELLPATKTSLEHVFVVNSAQIPNGTMNMNEIVGLANRRSEEIAKILRSRV